MLVSMQELLKYTRQHHFAVGAFNVADSCFVRAVVEEAEAANAPAIISIHPSEHDFVGDAFFAYVRDITLRSPVPFVIHLDHGASIEHVQRAIQCGFTSVMIDGSLLPYEENVALTREAVRLAHAVGVSVEGELGTIGQTGTSVEGGVSKVTYTDPAQAEDFVNRTGVDTLAVAIGTAHGIYPKGMQPQLQMHILKDIAGRTSIPLVLHGGSANPDAEIAESVTLGVGKVNISSDMKYAYFQKVREILGKETWWDPNVIYPEPIKAAREVIRYKMKLFNSVDKASLY
ncbi:ketose-bisphosphate aldolase [Mangrovibacter plantisponsor]|uniref:Fructose-bisphosphate aldolase n=1 Tax=Mangrovibacter plantisponsor TaxID=451513 RepID=A0A317PXN8_9ENTR|nr:ketose-bisphosphate aldolase [Mangrovibacter plantisponsor]PWW06701.1 fructose-bisphosphate aldolase [Mangrovibacter plantisponsor]